jgi:hypothetical protein|tara:strand:- start:2317 stop:2463 length:147 start_codon:yes stop_codon:yes gene_type:complete
MRIFNNEIRYPFKEMKRPNPNNSFDKVMAAIAILALIGFVVGLFKLMD